uniref:Globin n=1 Tax=Polypedilum nubifer TaxID=54969 RepID=V5YME9_9DIPT|nr:globin [Polypedilum nubifer]
MKFLIVLALIGAAAAYTPLSSDQYSLVKSTWDQVSHNEVDILYAIFKAYPDIQAKFPQFNGKDLDSVKGTPDFALHATRIVSFIGELVTLTSSEANAPAVQSTVEAFAVRHHNRGVTKDQFNEFRTAFFSYISSHSTWGDNAAAAWNQAIDNIYGIAFTKL